MPRIEDPCLWVSYHLSGRSPFFSVRYNDGEMMMMYKTVPEGKMLGTEANLAPANYQLGAELRDMLHAMAEPAGWEILIGCSWNTPRADKLCQKFEAEVDYWDMRDFNWCNEHWPLDGVVDGSTQGMIDNLRASGNVVLVTNERLADARHCLGAKLVQVPMHDSWSDRSRIFKECAAHAQADESCKFIWAAGCGLKPTAWRLFWDFPRTSHVDIGHLFNGVFGLRDYGWMKSGSGPWYDPYFSRFAPYVRGFIK